MSGNTLGRQELIDMLYEVLHAIYLFERREMETFGLSYPEILSLKILSRTEGLSIGDLAERMGSPLFTATRLVTRLVTAGLAMRTIDAHDRRSRLVGISAAGLAMVDRIDDHAVKLLQRTTAELPETEMRQLNHLARQFGRFLEVAPPAPAG